MPILTIRVNEQELRIIKQAARQHGRKTSEFSRNVLLSASRPAEPEKNEFPIGVLKGKTTYKQAMKLLRD
jgi:hypothetical protein